MSKYYTPDISEFYVGFEYEVDDTWGGYMKVTFKDFSPIAIGSGNDRIPFNYKARVKCLDEDDLKNFSLTKEEYNLEDYPFLRYYHVDPKIKEYNLYKFTTKYTYLQFWYSPNIKNDYCNLIITCFNDKDNLNCHFKGYIKNKSELQKLFKQLGINE